MAHGAKLDRRGLHLVGAGSFLSQNPLSADAQRVRDALNRFGVSTEDMRQAYLVLLELDCLPDGSAERFLFGGLRELEERAGGHIVEL